MSKKTTTWLNFKKLNKMLKRLEHYASLSVDIQYWNVANCDFDEINFRFLIKYDGKYYHLISRIRITECNNNTIKLVLADLHKQYWAIVDQDVYLDDIGGENKSIFL